MARDGRLRRQSGLIGTYALRLPNSIEAAATELALEEGVSLDQFIAAAVAEKIGVLRTTAEFLGERSGDAKPEDLPRSVRAPPQLRPVAGAHGQVSSSRTTPNAVPDSGAHSRSRGRRRNRQRAARRRRPTARHERHRAHGRVPPASRSQGRARAHPA